MKKLNVNQMEMLEGGVCNPLILLLTGRCITICPGGPGTVCPQ